MLARQRCLPYRVRKTTNTLHPPPTGRPGYTDPFAADPSDRPTFALAPSPPPPSRELHAPPQGGALLYLTISRLFVPLQTQRVDFAMSFAVQFGIELFGNGNTEDFHGKLSVSYRR